VLVDIAYPLNIATKIASGEVPYRDFPLAQAPGEFLVQALLIKAFGPQFALQIAYATLLGGLATALTYAIVRRLLRGAVERPSALAAVLAIPLIPLGIYAVYPHPFYDPDACLAVLVALLAIFAARDRSSMGRWLLAGVLLTIPIWIKQNIGGAFLVATVAVLAAEALAAPSLRRRFVWCLLGVASALGIEVVALQLFVGVDHYLVWAWTFALAGRGVTLDRLREFANPSVLWPGALILLLALIAYRSAPRVRGPLFIAGFGIALVASILVPYPFLAVHRMFPPLLLAASGLALFRSIREGPGFELLVPLVAAATTLGAAQSQALNGSTFGIFPLLIIALAALVRDLAVLVPRPARLAPLTGAALTLILAVSGSAYTVQNVRLRFIDVDPPGTPSRSTFPTLVGLSAKGPYVPDLDEILFWVRDNVPTEDGFVFLPGEDPVFYALNRRPHLPSVYFYDVATPYTPGEMARFADDVGLRWVFVKDRPQLLGEPPLEQALVAALTERASLVAHVGPYQVYRR
jgi:hypothetical protein